MIFKIFSETGPVYLQLFSNTSPLLCADLAQGLSHDRQERVPFSFSSSWKRFQDKERLGFGF